MSGLLAISRALDTLPSDKAIQPQLPEGFVLGLDLWGRFIRYYELSQEEVDFLEFWAFSTCITEMRPHAVVEALREVVQLRMMGTNFNSFAFCGRPVADMSMAELLSAKDILPARMRRGINQRER